MQQLLQQSRMFSPFQLTLLPAVGIQRLSYPKDAFSATTRGYNTAPSPVTDIVIVSKRTWALHGVCKDSRQAFQASSV